MNELIEVVEQYQDEIEPDIRTGWTPSSLTDADRALRRIGECERELAEVDELEAAAIRQVKERCEKLRRGPRGGIAFFEPVLRAWMERERSNLLKGKAKSRALVYGRVGWRASPERLKVTDKEALQAWIDALPNGSPFVRVKREPDMAAIQEVYVGAHPGAIPPGCEAVPAGDASYVKAEAPSEALAKREE